MTSSLSDVELVVRSIAQTVVDNEVQFGELDAVVGDGDFGYSLARSFEVVLLDWDSIDRSSIGTFLRKVGLIIVNKTGGTSGAIWGTAFMRAGSALGDVDEVDGTRAIAALRAAVEGIRQRGGADLGDKTLMDALVPAIDALEADLATSAGDQGGVDALQHAADVAVEAAAATSALIAKRGRAAYTGERSIGSPDAGAVAVGVIMQRVSADWRGQHGNDGGNGA